MRSVSTFLGIVLLFSLLAMTPAFTQDVQRAAEMNDQYRLFFQCAREALQTENLTLPYGPFRAVVHSHPLPCRRVYLLIDAPAAGMQEGNIVGTLEKNLYKIIARLHETLCDPLANECCSGLMIRFLPDNSLAALGGGRGGEEIASICLSKFDMKKLMSGRISVRDLLHQPFTVLQRNGQEIPVD